jgi:hypothetical protein
MTIAESSLGDRFRVKKGAVMAASQMVLNAHSPTARTRNCYTAHESAFWFANGTAFSRANGACDILPFNFIRFNPCDGIIF